MVSGWAMSLRQVPPCRLESTRSRFGNLEGYVRSLGRGLGVANGDVTQDPMGRWTAAEPVAE